MEENVRLELFTVRQVRDWLEHGKTERGLSEKLIARTRAWAIINNPYATDDLNIISAIFVNDEVAAYTYLFPDEQEGQRIYWNTTIYCAPEYRGRGYSAIVIGQFCELYGEHYFDLDAADASIANLKFCGLIVDYVPLYVLSNKAIRGNGLRANIARFAERITYLKANRKNELLNDIQASTYRLKYTSIVNDDVYAFIRAHSDNDVFLRSKEIFNWILQTPFMQDTPLVHRAKKDTEFTAMRGRFQLYGVEVYREGELIAFYILNVSDKSMDVSYLYYNPDDERDVFLSIAEHVLYFNKAQFSTAIKKLWSFIGRYKIYTKPWQRMKSFSHPPEYEYDKSSNMQLGDGDNLT